MMERINKKLKLKVSKSSKYRVRKKTTAMIYASSESETDLNQPILKQNCSAITPLDDLNDFVSGQLNLNNRYDDNPMSLETAEIEDTPLEVLSDSDECYSTTSEYENPSIDSEDLCSVLAKWALLFNISKVAVSDLLKKLKLLLHLKELPQDARTLLKTPKITQVRAMEDGHYYYFGIENSIKMLDKESVGQLPSELLLVVGIDGISVTKNPPSHLWPIMGYYSNLSYKKPVVFLIGLYFGKKKPNDPNNYLKEFVDEFKLMKQTILKYNNKEVTVKLHAVICDAPAKSFVLNCRGHTGRYSCVRCTTSGERAQNTSCFPELDAPLRTHTRFIEYQYEGFHNGNTILAEVPGFDVILSVPYDYMHLVCIGVVKKILSFWISVKHRNDNKLSLIISSLH